MNKELFKGSVKTIVLTILADKSMHGYELLSQIKDKSEEKFEITEGTLYPLLHSLEQDGALISEWQTTAGKKKKKVYKITPAGRKLLKSRTKELIDFISTMKNLVPIK